MPNYEQILQWVATQFDINKVPQSTIYERYAKAFDKPMTKTQFGRFMNSQFIFRSTMRDNGKVTKRWNTALNPEFIYNPIPRCEPCPNCKGTGVITITT